jgi:hypothetical protein
VHDQGAAQNEEVSWFRSVPKVCYCTSPKGYWCTRTDRHAGHEAAGGGGRVYSRWKGDHPNEQELIEAFSSAEAFRNATGPGTGGVRGRGRDGQDRAGFRFGQIGDGLAGESVQEPRRRPVADRNSVTISPR